MDFIDFAELDVKMFVDWGLFLFIIFLGKIGS